jgi:hypothetical protein
MNKKNLETNNFFFKLRPAGRRGERFFLLSISHGVKLNNIYF